MLDYQISFDDHIISIVRVCDYHIRALHHIHSLINREIENTITSSIVCTRQHYFNSVLYHQIERGSSPASSNRTGIHCMYCTIPCTYMWWLAIRQQNIYKIATLTFRYGFMNNLTDLIVDHTPS